MIEGIIQKWWKNCLKGRNAGMMYECDLQELIEQIRDYELLCYKEKGEPTTYIPKIRLIGYDIIGENKK